jgi:hypothetical protein
LLTSARICRPQRAEARAKLIADIEFEAVGEGLGRIGQVNAINGEIRGCYRILGGGYVCSEAYEPDQPNDHEPTKEHRDLPPIA